MPKFRVHICRVAYSHLDIEIDAGDKEDAAEKAEQEAGNYTFPTENASEYSIEGVTEI